MENTNPLVSIVTVTYNRGKLIGRCIKSIQQQTYRNFEHIIVDGGSTDETDEVIASFEDNRIKHIKLKENQGFFRGINIGASEAKGKYLTFLDSDDEYLPEKIEKQLKLIESLPEDYGMVYCWMTYFDSAKNNSLIRVHNTNLRGYVPIDASIRPCVSGTPTIFVKRNLFIEAGGYDDKADMTTDWEFCARFCHKWKVDYVPESLVNVYVNHIYERMSTEMRYNKAFLKKRIAMHESYLKEFSNTFDKRPGSRWYNYQSLAFFCLKDKDIIKTFKYSVLFLFSLIQTLYVKYFGSKE